MYRRQFFGTMTAPLLAAQIPSQRPPNILFVIFDKCRTDAIGAYGERRSQTPNIDALAASGIRFENCFTPQALCGPARASILTGLYPHRHGLRRNVYPTKPSAMNSNYQEAIPDPFRDTRFDLWDNFVFYLSNAGYITGAIGKWHLGPGNPGFFDYFKAFNSTLRHWIGKPHHSRYRPDVHTELGMSFIEQHAGGPFFLYQSYYAPHEPLDPPAEFLEKHRGEEHAAYHAAVSNLDWNVGRLVETLRRKNILDETLIIVTTEHGRSWQPRPGTAEGMCTAYEESSRIPLILRYPRLLPSGGVWRSGVSLVDLAPTILETAGIQAVKGGILEPAGGSFFQGHSLIGLVRAGNDTWRRPIVMENIPQAAIDGSFYEERALRTERYKLILRKFDNRPELRPGELYDLQTDPREERNLYPHSQALVKQLAGQLAAWGRQYHLNYARRWSVLPRPTLASR
ncbi:MAG: sulfatase-like hydrolase/transferase [Bryobacterales bacterium]|nr:sulfatase-like hydrolase/transferase [Bryobacterales bacterium]